MFRRFLSAPIDWVTIIIPTILTVTGIITIYTITFAQEKSGLATSQIIFALIGLVTMVVAMFSDYRHLRSFANILYALGVIMLILLVPPLAAKIPFTLKIFGAYRWLDLGFFQLQPGEIFKLIAAIFGAKILTQHIGLIDWKKTLVYILFSAVPILLVLSQPDLGTASVILVVFAACFLAARPSGRIVTTILTVFIISLPLIWANLRPYQQSRVETLLNPASDPQGQGYNVRQSLIAIGSGGLTGRGFGQGSQTVLNFLPVAHTDFVFSGFAEATGFVGSIVIIFLYMLLIYRAINIASISTDKFGQLLAIAIAAKLLFQVTVHIGMNLGLLPVTGIPLPFMSGGGTSLIIDLLCIGILQSIHIRHKRTGLG
ncbi:MAG: FtsW/RodA/SpoVE family cell cycle protein [Patescibacteria group bacterium]|mgnify:CR=1 FL=1